MDEPNSQNRATTKAADVNQSRRWVPSSLLVALFVVITVGIFFTLVLPSVSTPREAYRRNQCLSQLKQIALALHRYAELHGQFPPAYTVDVDGNRLHSWRTMILPFMEEQRLHDTIDFAKPWNDPVNAAAFNTVVELYQCPSVSDLGNRTTYLAIVTPDSLLRDSVPRNLSDIPEEFRKSLMVIEVDKEHAVPWMSPYDTNETIILNLGGPKSTAAHPGVFQAASVEGGAQFIRAETTTEERRAMITFVGVDDRGADSETPMVE